MTLRAGAPPHHNTTTCYTAYRCRLPECVDRYNTKNQERLQARRSGTYNRYVDAEPVRRHIVRLQHAGMSLSAIGVAAGLSTQSIIEFVQPGRSKGRGRRYRTTPEKAATILAITPADRTVGRIDATGTHRRLQALVAVGWPIRYVARHAGLFDSSSFSILQRKWVYFSTAKAVEAAYEELRDLKPARHGVSKQHAAAAKNRAARLRWQPPKYWDDPDHPIDDPDFEPQTAGQAIAYEARWLMQVGGLDVAQAAKRLRRSCSYVTTCLTDYPEDGRAAA